MLEHHLGNSFMEKEEIDKKTVIRTNWKKLIKQVTKRFYSQCQPTPFSAHNLGLLCCIIPIKHLGRGTLCVCMWKSVELIFP